MDEGKRVLTPENRMYRCEVTPYRQDYHGEGEGEELGYDVSVIGLAVGFWTLFFLGVGGGPTMVLLV